MKALIVVDIQNDFLPGGALAVPGGDQVIPVANELIPCFEHVYATQDWHPANHGSFAVNHPGRQPGDVVDLNGIEQVLWPSHCIQNSWGASFAPGLNTGRFERLFRKGIDPGIDSYSTFFDNAHRRSTGLGEYLEGKGIVEVYIMGLATDYCVLYSVLDARELGLTVRVVEDGCRGIELRPGDTARAYESMRRAGASIIRASEVICEPEGARER
jgi:nicotinamidase/pyrazinamidase